MHVGLRLRSLRRERNLTLRQVAEATGWSVSHWSEVERGVNQASVAALTALREFYNVGWDCLLFVEPVVEGTRVDMWAFAAEPQRVRGEQLSGEMLALLGAVARARGGQVQDKDHWWGLLHVVRGVLGYSVEGKAISRRGLRMALGLAGKFLADLAAGGEAVLRDAMLGTSAEVEEVGDAKEGVVELIMLLRQWQRLLAE